MNKMKSFSNGTEACQWLDRNCEQCKFQRCGAKRAIELGFITGEITLHFAEWIGLNETKTSMRLFDNCQHFSTTPTNQRPSRHLKKQSGNSLG